MIKRCSERPTNDVQPAVAAAPARLREQAESHPSPPPSKRRRKVTQAETTAAAAAPEAAPEADGYTLGGVPEKPRSGKERMED